MINLGLDSVFNRALTYGYDSSNLWLLINYWGPPPSLFPSRQSHLYGGTRFVMDAIIIYRRPPGLVLRAARS